MNVEKYVLVLKIDLLVNENWVNLLNKIGPRISDEANMMNPRR